MPAAEARPRIASAVRGAELYVTAPDGTERRRVPTPANAEVAQPAWAPDGTELAHVTASAVSDNPLVYRIALTRADGLGRRILTRGHRDTSPAFSPDGSSIAFERARRGSYRFSSIAVVGRGGGAVRLLTSRASDGEPAWSPDGSRIAFTRAGRRGLEIWSMRADGGDQRRLAAAASGPTWSPDGTRIAFVSDRDRFGETCFHDSCSPNGEIYVMSADGSGQTRITRSRASDESPAWSPDGSTIAFSSDRHYPDGTSPEVYAMRPDGSCVTRVTNVPGDSREPAWEPAAGDASPGVCGGDAAGARAPAQELDLTNAREVTRPVYWLGPTLGTTLLSHADHDVHGWFNFIYADCLALRPRECEGQIQLQLNHVCTRHPLMYDVMFKSHPRMYRLRGALVSDHGGGQIDVHTGDVTVALFLDPRRPGGVRRVIEALRPLSAEPVADLPAPALPTRDLAEVRRAQAAYRALGRVGPAARRLRISPAQVVQRLRLGRALERFGPLPATRCPAPRRRPV